MLGQIPSASARYAAIVMDADSGRVIHEVEAGHRWYPASLTKVMTIYMTFAALEAGRLQLNDVLTVSAHAARQPNSKLGLRQGQSISVEHAIMAVTTRSANDAAVVLAERLGGSENNFATMMTEQAHSLGMHSSSFHNASGLPDEGQISSARDLALLSAALIRDFPQYYRYFSATEFAYKGRVLPNTNKILKIYPDADGLKTGFTCGSGYNLIASAKRDGRRLIGVLLGARSSAERFQQMGNLLDLGFEKSRAGVFGLPVEQISDASLEPPPFQLSSNRCAGSAEQMGADSDAGRPEPIRIKPGKSSLLVQKPSTKVRSSNLAASSNWAVMLNDRSRKVDADIDLNRARRVLGVAAKSGEAQVIRVKIKGRHFWRSEWIGLDQADARSFCNKLRVKGFSCSLLPGNV
ncbi:MAG: D-alanyl-D-alanine carboxypeptidase [Methylomonas sp.]|nr:D-alanyl-D-alanine carboxypeptidase [Methylomonas sp.]